MGADSKERTTGDYHAVSCSGGKDSTAMLLLMIERQGLGWPSMGTAGPVPVYAGVRAS